MTALRGGAALWVFLYHLQLSGVTKSTLIARYGYAGVGFFFVLSGFVLAWSTSPQLPARVFWRRRFARIYPATLLVTLIAIVVPYKVHAATVTSTLTSVFFVQAWSSNPNVIFGLSGVTWSLSCEAFFYLLLPFVVLRASRTTNRRRVSAALIWFAIAGLAVILATRHQGTDPALGNIAFSNPIIRSGEFGLGLIAAIEIRDGWLPPTWLGPALVLAGIGATRAISTTRPAPDATLGLAFLGIILITVRRELRAPRGILASRPLVYAGEISFCFYLVHELVLANVIGEGRQDGNAVATVIFLAATLLAIALHELVEKPLQSRIRGSSAPPSIANSALAVGLPGNAFM